MVPREAAADDVTPGRSTGATSRRGPPGPDGRAGGPLVAGAHGDRGPARRRAGSPSGPRASGSGACAPTGPQDSAAHIPAVAHGPDGVQVAVSGGGDPGRARAIRDAISDLLAEGAPPPAPHPPPRIASGSSGSRRRTRSLDTQQTRRVGRVLVGGGPGDPGLLTVSGRQWLARADVVVTDRLGPTSVLSELGADVEIIDVGKTAGNHPIPQHEINRILVEHARAGRIVVRLKGGDPFVLGPRRRGGPALPGPRRPGRGGSGGHVGGERPRGRRHPGDPPRNHHVAGHRQRARRCRTGPGRRPHGTPRRHPRAADGPVRAGRHRRGADRGRSGSRAPRSRSSATDGPHASAP